MNENHDELGRFAESADGAEGHAAAEKYHRERSKETTGAIKDAHSKAGRSHGLAKKNDV